MAEINMDEKVTVINLAPWNVSFPNNVGRGDTCFAPSAKVRVKRDEISDQVSAGNKLFGLDSYGSHATLYIDDADTRKYLVGAFEMLYTKYVDAPEKKHGTK